MMSGTCTERVELFGKSAVRPKCKPLINTVYKDRRTGFYFTTDDYIVTFSGVAPQVKTSADSSVQPIDLVLFNDIKNGDPNNTTKLSAAGTCDFANPFRGIQVMVKCKAETSRGRFKATFRSDGSEPEILMQGGKMLTR